MAGATPRNGRAAEACPDTLGGMSNHEEAAAAVIAERTGVEKHDIAVVLG